MNYLKKITVAITVLLAGSFMLLNSVHVAAADKTLSIGAGSGIWGDTVSVPITINTPTGVGGVAFTMTYDKDVFEFTGLEQATKAISDGTDSPMDIENTMIYQVNDDTENERVLVAAASALELTSSTLFKAKFLIKNNAQGGTYLVGLHKTIILNPDAGYNTPTFINPVVGMPAQQANAEGYYPTPTFSTLLVGGSITVSPPPASLYTISGSITYEGGGSAANGTPVFLKKLVYGVYTPDAQTTVNSGVYSFAGKAAGDYRVCVISLNPNYYNNHTDVIVVDSNVTADVELFLPIRVSGSVFINGGYLPGLKIKVKSGGQVVGVYAVSPDGTYRSGPLSPGTYTSYAVYGSLESDVSIDNLAGNNWVVPLYSIGGAISGLSGGETVTVEAGSVSGKMRKAVTVNGNDTYTIDNLVPANDYKVSAEVSGVPIIFYNQKVAFSEADAVDISAGNATGKDFDFGSVNKAVISGTVTEGGTPVEGIGVYAFNINTYALAAKPTDASGDYSLTLTPGTYEIFVIKDTGKIFYYDADDAVDSTTQNYIKADLITVGNGQTIDSIDIDVLECDKSLSGTVTYERPDGPPVINALVTAESADNLSSDITDNEGNYLLTGICDGVVYTIEMVPLDGNYAIQTESITGGSDTVLDFLVDIGHELEGSVKDAGDSSAIPGAMIFLVAQDTGILAGGQIYFSENDGSYSIGDISTGVYTLRVSHPLYRTYNEEDLVIDADTAKDISLVQGAHFRGTVLDGSNGNVPLKNALIIVARLGGEPQYDLTDINGEYSVYGLDETMSDYLILAVKRGYDREVAINQTPATGGGTVVDFNLTHPTSLFGLSGTITSDCNGSTPVSNALIVVASSNARFFDSTNTDINGAYSFEDLPQADDYRFVVVPGGDLQVYRDSPLTVTTGSIASGTATKDVILPCGNDISGTVTWSGGGTAYVLLYTSGNKFVAFKTVDTSGGSFVFKGLTEGAQYKIFVSAGSTTEFYNDQTGIGSATLITAPDNTINIDLTQ